MKKIGILGGLGPESTAACYECITRDYYRRYGNYAYPEIIIYSLSFQEFIGVEYESAAKVKEAIGSLHKAGADFVIAPCNSIHIVFEEVVGDIPIPWFSIVDAAAEEVRENDMNRVGLLGTIFTMSRGFYKERLAQHQIETVTPSGEDQKTINNIIFEELVLNEIKDKSRRTILEIIGKLKDEGAQGIVLGCTELPFLIKQEHADIRVLDTAVIYARKALDIAMGNKSP